MEWTYIVEQYHVYEKGTDDPVFTINFFNTGDMETLQHATHLDPAGIVAAIANADDAFNGGDNAYYFEEASEPLYLSPTYTLVKDLIPDEQYQGWWFVNVYERGRAYGGPEEGGWYYTYYLPITPCETFPLMRFNNKQKAQDAAHELTDGHEYLHANGTAYAVMVERETPMPKPTYTPRYS